MPQQIDYFPTLRQLRIHMQYGLTDEACLAILWDRLYGKNFCCTHCGASKFYKLENRPVYCCEYGHHFSPLAHTIFRKSHTPLSHWFTAIYLVIVSDGKVPANELQRRFNNPYKTAWRMKYLICKYLGLQSGPYSYRYSSAINGRHYQLKYLALQKDGIAK